MTVIPFPAPIDPQLRILRYGLRLKTTTNQVIPRKGTLDQIESEFRGHGRKYKTKDGPLFHPQEYRIQEDKSWTEGKKENIVAHHFLVGDIDGTIPKCDVDNRLIMLRFAFLVHSTWSHGDLDKERDSGKDGARFRIIAPYARPLQSNQDELAMRKWLDALLGGGVIGKSELSNLNLGFFTPRKKNPKSNLEPWITRGHGPVLDPDDLPHGRSVTDLLEQKMEVGKQEQKAQKAKKRQYNGPTGTDEAEVASALNALDPDMGNDDWVKVGMAVHSFDSGQRGLDLWDSWSSGGNKHKQGECERRWRSFKPGDVTKSTLFKMAIEAGWTAERTTAVRPTRLKAVRSPDPPPMAGTTVRPPDSPPPRGSGGGRQQGGGERKGRKRIVLRGADPHVHAVEILDEVRVLTDDAPRPVFFLFQGTMAIMKAVNGASQIDRLKPKSIPAFLSEHFEFAKMKKSDGEKESLEEVPCKMQLGLAQHVHDLAGSGRYHVPEVLGIIRAPVFAGTPPRLLMGSYLERSLHRWVQVPDLDLDRPASPIEAIEVICDLLFDFPFVDNASMTHAIALGLTILMRPLIHGHVPLFMVSAPSPGTGKSLLVDTIRTVVEGSSTPGLPAPLREEEWQKLITSILLNSPTAVLLDNVSRRIRSASLASVVTQRTWEARELGRTGTLKLPNEAVWIATGNNPTFNGEIARRVIEIKMDAEQEHPEDRSGFKHPLPTYARIARAHLLGAFVVLIEDWVNAGSPLARYVFGSFEEWATIVGGVLDHHHFDGFLDNRQATRTATDPEAEEWRAFVLVWWIFHQGTDVEVGTLLQLARQQNHLDDTLSDCHTPRSERCKLGKALNKRRDQIIEGYRIQRAPKGSGTRRATYRLVCQP